MDYTALISETEQQLLELETRQRLAIYRDRVRFIRLLKNGQAKTQQQAGAAINIALRQSQRLWKTYSGSGLKALIQPPPQPGFGKLSAYQISQLRSWLGQDQAQRLQDIQTYVAQRWQISYTLAGISTLCKRLKIKPKTGRPVNLRQNPAAPDLFKKTLSS